MNAAESISSELGNLALADYFITICSTKAPTKTFKEFDFLKICAEFKLSMKASITVYNKLEKLFTFEA